MAWSLVLLSIFGAIADKKEAPNVAQKPYRVHVWLDFESHPRFPDVVKVWVEQQFHQSVRLYLGDAWTLSVAPRPATLTPARRPTTKELTQLNLQADKLLWVRIHANSMTVPTDPQAVRLTGWEYDFEFDDWSGPSEHTMRQDERFADEIFDAAYRQFRPHASIIGQQKSGKVQIQLRGLALQPAHSKRPLAPAGMPFRVFRKYVEKDELIALNEIPYTYLLYRQPARNRLLAECDLVSALRSALSRRTSRRSELLALGSSQSATASTMVRFVTNKDQFPVVGMEVSLRPQDRSARVPIGTTDHHGQIRVQAIRLASEVGLDIPDTRMFELRLSAGDAVIAALPLIPGETDDLEVAVSVDPLLTEVSGMVAGLQDQLLDAVVARKVLNTQLDLYAAENDVENARKIGEQLNRQLNFEYFETRLKSIRAHAETRMKELERPSLGNIVVKLFVQTESLLRKFGADLVDRKITVATEVKAPDKPKEPEKTSP